MCIIVKLQTWLPYTKKLISYMYTIILTISTPIHLQAEFFLPILQMQLQILCNIFHKSRARKIIVVLLSHRAFILAKAIPSLTRVYVMSNFRRIRSSAEASIFDNALIIGVWSQYLTTVPTSRAPSLSGACRSLHDL